MLLWYVYLLESEGTPGQRYAGSTSDLQKRLAEHNSGKSAHTSKYMPWQIATYVAFSDERKALAFEHYLKSGSGQAFASKRLWSVACGEDSSALPAFTNASPNSRA